MTNTADIIAQIERIINNDTDKNIREKLLRLWEASDKETFCEWAIRGFFRLQEAEILQSKMHGGRLLDEASQEESGVDDSALPCKEIEGENLLRGLWRERQKIGHPSQGRELAEQYAGELTMFMQKLSPKSPSKNELAKVISQMRYIVRRLTPTECCRLMGLPDGWTIPSNLDITDELVEEFRTVHDNYNRIMAEYEGANPPKPKSSAQVRKWLEKIANPATCPDAPRYKGCGNGWATNQPRWILTRMLAADGIDPWEDAR